MESKLTTRRKYRVKNNRKKNETAEQKYDIDITNEITNTNLLNSLHELSLNIYRDITYLVHSSVNGENRACFEIKVTYLSLGCPRHSGSNLFLSLVFFLFWCHFFFSLLWLFNLLLLLRLFLFLFDSLEEVGFHLTSKRQSKLLNVITEFVPGC